MDSSRDLSFAPAADVPLHRNAPLAPTQELAYRKKCIQLKRRLTEIEANNDATRKRIVLETEHVQKMRLLRAILLEHLNQIMTTPAKKLTPEQLEKIGLLANGGGNLAELAGASVVPEMQQKKPDGEALLDDSSEESEDDEPEPLERPERRKRAPNPYRETVMHASALGDPDPEQSNSHQQSTLPSIAPAANSFGSPATPHDAATHSTSFGASGTSPQPAGHATRGHRQSSDPHYAHSSPPGHSQQPPASLYQSPGQARGHSAAASSTDVNGYGGRSTAGPTRPDRPDTPFVQFTNHMRPQLEADNYPSDHIPSRIQSEWEGLSAENRKLWDDRYEEQMREYTAAMDAYKRAARRDASATGFS